jgi:peptide/nickel transport system permease protein
MWRYTLRRLAFLPVILLAVSLIAFFVLRVLPSGDPVDVIGGADATPEQQELIREDLGLDKPVWRQYVDWLTAALHGDFGQTYRSRADVREEMVRRLPPSMQLVGMSLFFSAIFGISFGILSALYRNSPFDYFVRMFAVLAASVPEFFLLTLLVIIPSYLWNYVMPLGGYVPIYEDPLQNLELFLPAALIIGLGGSAGLMRLTRTTMLEVLRSDYVRTARAKGLRGHTVILAHAFRNSLTPIVTALGTAFLAIFNGSVIAEYALSINGVGRFLFESALARDLVVVQFLVVYTAALVVLVNLIVDLSYAWVDPRVKYR